MEHSGKPRAAESGLISIYEKYVEVLRRNLPAGAEPIEGPSSLEALGLDSLGTIKLLADIETTFGLELPDEALELTTFRTVDSLWEVLRCIGWQSAD